MRCWIDLIVARILAVWPAPALAQETPASDVIEIGWACPLAARSPA